MSRVGLGPPLVATFTGPNRTEPGAAVEPRNGLGTAPARPSNVVLDAPEAPQPERAPVQRSNMPPAGSSAAGSSAAGPPAPPERAATGPRLTAADVDELAVRLYDRMLVRLRRDLRRELERKGQSANLRR